MGAVSRAESIHYKHLIVNQISKLLREAFAVLGLVITSESGVLKQNNVAVIHLGNTFLSHIAGDSVILGKHYIYAGKKLCKSLGNGSQ